MATMKLSDEVFLAFLERHPDLPDRFALIVSAVENSEGSLKEADMVKGFGRRPPARAGQGMVRPAFESLPRRKPRSGKGAGAARTIYGDLRIAGCRRRGLEAGVDRACAGFGDRMAGLRPLPESVLACGWR